MTEETIKELDKRYEEIAGITTFEMPKPDPINTILKKAQKIAEKRVKKALKGQNPNEMLKYLYSYRIFTKLLNREMLTIFDFYKGE